MYKRRLIIGLLLCFFAFNGCGKEKKVEKEPSQEKVFGVEPFLIPAVEEVAGGEGWKGEESAIRELIVSYNKAVTNTQIHISSLAELKGFTSKREFTRMNASVEKDRVEGKIMSCTLARLDFKEIVVKRDAGVVKTTEDWFFEDRDLKTGAILVPLRDFQYKVEYNVIKKEGKWLVDGLKLKKVSEFLPPRGRPRRVNILKYNEGGYEE